MNTYNTHVGLCESSFFTARVLCRDLIEYSAIQMLPGVAINYRVVQNKPTPGLLLNSVVQQRFEVSQNN